MLTAASNVSKANYLPGAGRAAGSGEGPARDDAMKDDEDQFLLNVYQEAVNADAVEERLKKEQAKIQKALAIMPYNRKDIEVVEVSDDSISDIPLCNWKIPPTADKIPKIKKLAQTWLNFARQYINLK